MLGSPFLDEEIAGGLDAVLVRVDDHSVKHPPMHRPGSSPLVIIGVAESESLGEQWPSATSGSVFDVVVGEHDPALDAIIGNIERFPIAATSLAVLLRNGVDQSIEQALAAESAVYSTLQSGPEFAAWRTSAGLSPPPSDDGPAVLTERHGAALHIELNRPARHNAFSRSMRDGLFEALAFALLDDSIEHVELSGRGPSFCSGGDLGEFGSRPDPATAHRTRLTRSPARLLARLDDRLRRRRSDGAGGSRQGGVTVQLHGACLGAGIELAAFACHVVAATDARIGLPEVTLGLIPGAGGTVSLPRRIGRQRTAYLGLSGRPIDAETALQWGLVDEIADERR